MNSFNDLIKIAEGAEMAADYLHDYAVTKVKPPVGAYIKVNKAADAIELLHNIIGRLESENYDLKDQMRRLRGEVDDLEAIKQAYLASGDYGTCEDDGAGCLVGVRA